jgi:DNA-binding beta-propeller fold protein YncE
MPKGSLTSINEERINIISSMWEENFSRKIVLRVCRSAIDCVLLCVFIFLSGCAAKYSVRSGQSPTTLQWPYAPAKAKLIYAHEIVGFQRGGQTSILKAIAGSNQKQNDLFALPVAIATGHDGRIAVADTGRKCVHLYIPGKNSYTRIFGPAGDPIASPVSVAFDDELRLYVSDSSGKILVFGNNGAFLTAWRKAGQEVLKRPTGLAYNPNGTLIYVVDTLESKVYALRKDGTLAFSFGRKGEGEAQFNFPTHIFHSSAGLLYVTDSLNFRVQIFDEQGSFKGLFGHHGDGSGDLAMPKGIAVDRQGVIYVVDSLFDNLQLFNEEGQFLLTVGKRGLSFGEFWLPSGAFIDDRNQLYVCDTYNHRVQVFNIAEQYP